MKLEKDENLEGMIPKTEKGEVEPSLPDLISCSTQVKAEPAKDLYEENYESLEEGELLSSEGDDRDLDIKRDFHLEAEVTPPQTPEDLKQDVIQNDNLWNTGLTNLSEPVFNLPLPVPATSKDHGLPSPIHVASIRDDFFSHAPGGDFHSEARYSRKRSGGWNDYETSLETAPKRTKQFDQVYDVKEFEERLNKAHHLPDSHNVTTSKGYINAGINTVQPQPKPSTETAYGHWNQVLDESKLSAIIAKGRSVTKEHYVDVKYPDQPVRQRYRDMNFKFEPPESRKHPMKDQRYMEDPRKCRHRKACPLLTITSCAHCGKRHKEPHHCAILRYHKDLPLFESDRPILEQFPCAYCDSVNHTTRLCYTMHSYCKDCQVRGHRPFNKRGKMLSKHKYGKCHITPELLEEYTSKFKKLWGYGLYTSKASSESHRWGFKVSESHLCSKTEWSDSEDEGEAKAPQGIKNAKGLDSESKTLRKNTLLNNQDLQTIFTQPSVENLWSKPIQTDSLKLPIRERYRFENFKYDSPSERKTKKYMKQYERCCRHRSSNVVLTLNSCAHCGKSHDEAKECAIVRYQQGGDLFESDCPILKHYPCAYCCSAKHTTYMCDVMQAYCRTCKYRGHRPIDKKGRMVSKRGGGKCHITEEKLNDYKTRFNQLSSRGIHTKKNQGKEVHKWGLVVPENHICSEDHWSDTDEDC